MMAQNPIYLITQNDMIRWRRSGSGKTTMICWRRPRCAP